MTIAAMVYCCHEGFDVSVETCGDAAPVLEAAEHAFNDVTLPIDRWVAIEFDLAMFLGAV